MADEAKEWEKRFKIVNELLSNKRQELVEAHSVIAQMHPDNFSAFSKYSHLRVCQDAEKIWKEVAKKIKITHRTESHFEVEILEPVA